MGDETSAEIRPLPPAPRCQGIPLGDGNYTGCVYGYGNLTPLTGPCDWPVCHGSGIEGVPGTTLPHSSFGDPDCCGCLNGIVRGDWADIVCNECDAVVRTVPAADLERRKPDWPLYSEGVRRMLTVGGESKREIPAYRQELDTGR